MKRACKVSNVHGEVHFKGKQMLTIVFNGNALPNKKQFRKSAEDFIVDKIACHQHSTLPKLNSPTMLPRNHKLRNTSQQKPAPCRSPTTDKTCFHKIQTPTEKHIQTDLKNRVKFLVHKLFLPKQNQNYTVKR